MLALFTFLLSLAFLFFLTDFTLSVICNWFLQNYLNHNRVCSHAHKFVCNLCLNVFIFCFLSGWRIKTNTNEKMYTIGFSFSGEFPRKMIHVFQVRFSHNKQTFKHAYTFVTFRFFVCIQLKSKLSLSACFVLFLSTQHAFLHDVFSLL